MLAQGSLKCTQIQNRILLTLCLLWNLTEDFLTFLHLEGVVEKSSVHSGSCFLKLNETLCTSPSLKRLLSWAAAAEWQEKGYPQPFVLAELIGWKRRVNSAWINIYLHVVRALIEDWCKLWVWGGVNLCSERQVWQRIYTNRMYLYATFQTDI